MGITLSELVEFAPYVAAIAGGFLLDEIFRARVVGRFDKYIHFEGYIPGYIPKH